MSDFQSVSVLDPFTLNDQTLRSSLDAIAYPPMRGRARETLQALVPDAPEPVVGAWTEDSVLNRRVALMQTMSSPATNTFSVTTLPAGACFHAARSNPAFRVHVLTYPFVLDERRVSPLPVTIWMVGTVTRAPVTTRSVELPTMSIRLFDEAGSRVASALLNRYSGGVLGLENDSSVPITLDSAVLYGPSYCAELPPLCDARSALQTPRCQMQPFDAVEGDIVLAEVFLFRYASKVPDGDPSAVSWMPIFQLKALCLLDRPLRGSLAL